MSPDFETSKKIAKIILGRFAEEYSTQITLDMSWSRDDSVTIGFKRGGDQWTVRVSGHAFRALVDNTEYCVNSVLSEEMQTVADRLGVQLCQIS